MKLIEDIATALDEMAIIDQQTESLRYEKQKMIDSVLTPEIQQKIKDINAEFAPLETAAFAKRQEKESFVRNNVVVLVKGTVTGKYLQAVYTDGKWSWDMKKVEKYLKEHPELNDMREKGSPFVSIKKVNRSAEGGE